jgi:hypothetical protein
LKAGPLFSLCSVFALSLLLVTPAQAGVQLSPVPSPLLVIPAQAGIQSCRHLRRSNVARLDYSPLRGSPSGPFAARTFAPACGLRSPAYAGMTSQEFNKPD